MKVSFMSNYILKMPDSQSAEHVAAKLNFGVDGEKPATVKDNDVIYNTGSHEKDSSRIKNAILSKFHHSGYYVNSAVNTILEDPKQIDFRYLDEIG